MNRIRKARLAADMSQKYVAMMLGVAAPSVSNWESGKTSPTLDNMTALSELLGVSVDYLLGADEPTQVCDNTQVVDDEAAREEHQNTVSIERLKELVDLAGELDDDAMALLHAYLAEKKRRKTGAK